MNRATEELFRDDATLSACAARVLAVDAAGTMTRRVVLGFATG